MDYTVSAKVDGKDFSINLSYTEDMKGTLYKEAYDAIVVHICQYLGVPESKVCSEIFRTMAYVKS